MSGIEIIQHQDQVFAYLIRATVSPAETQFFTPEQENLQVGFVVYPQGGEVVPHTHKRFQRTVEGTAEVLLVRKGHCFMDIFHDDQRLFTTRELHAGDTVLLISGGHGFRMIEDTTFLEVKQGPYTGIQEKDRFHPDPSIYDSSET